MLQLFQPLHIGGFQAPVRRLPLVGRRGADAVVPPDLVDGATGVGLFQNRHELRFGELRLPQENLLAGVDIVPESSPVERSTIQGSLRTDFNDLHRLRGLESVCTQAMTAIGTMSGMSGSDSNGWPDPMPIRADLLPVEPLHLQLIPCPFRAWVKDLSDRMQCPPVYVAAGMVVMAGPSLGPVAA